MMEVLSTLFRICIIGMVAQGVSKEDASQTRLVRKMVGQDVNFTWQLPFENNTWKTLFGPSGMSIIRIGQDSAPEYEHPSLYKDRVSLLPDGVMLKDLSSSDEGLYKTEENFPLRDLIILLVHTERELQPIILADDTQVTSTSSLTKISQTIRVVTQLELPANITLIFSNGWNTVSCVSVQTCAYDVKNVPKPAYNFTVYIDVDYGFYDKQIILPISVDASEGVRNTAESNNNILIISSILMVVVFGILLVVLISFIRIYQKKKILYSELLSQTKNMLDNPKVEDKRIDKEQKNQRRKKKKHQKAKH